MKFLKTLLSLPFILLKLIWGILIILSPILQKAGTLILIALLLLYLPVDGFNFSEKSSEYKFNTIMQFVVFAGLPIFSPYIFEGLSALNDRILERILIGREKKTVDDGTEFNPGNSGLTKEEFIQMINESRKAKQVNLASLSDEEIRRLTEDFTEADWHQFAENLTEDELRRLAKIFNQV